MLIISALLLLMLLSTVQKIVVHFFFVSVDGGHRAVIFDRFTGVKEYVVGEGTHFLIPWVQKPIIFDIRSRARSVPTITGSKGMLSLLPPPRRLCFRLGLSVCLFVCEQDNSKSYGRILIKFSGYVRNGKRKK